MDERGEDDLVSGQLRTPLSLEGAVGEWGKVVASNPPLAKPGVKARAASGEGSVRFWSFMTLRGWIKKIKQKVNQSFIRWPWPAILKRSRSVARSGGSLFG